MASSIMKYAVVVVFMFSTIYTMGFYWYAGQSQSIAATGLDELDGGLIAEPESTGWLTSAVTSAMDYVLEVVSWFSPFAVIKGLLYTITPALIYEPLNLLLLRPLGWLGAWITTEWVINKIRGSSEG